MLIEVSSKEFKLKFGSDTHPYISEQFIELNKEKVDRVVWLIEDKDKVSIGLVAGIKNGMLKAPFSAPYGGFHYRSEHIYVSEIERFLEELKEYAKNQKIHQIFITLPPSIYQKSFNAKAVNTLIRLGFEMLLPDITTWVELKQFNGEFSHKSSREFCRQAIRNQLRFNILSSNNEKESAYNLIRENRERYNRPIYMTYDDIIQTSTLWPVVFFGVNNSEGQMVASGIFYQFPQNVAFAVFWGDNDTGRPLRAMDFLILNLWNHYKSAGFEYIDLGISTETGVPNESLLRFKETHECTSSLRSSFCWNN